MPKKSVVAAVVAVPVAALLAPTGVQAAVNYFDTTKVVYGTGHATCPTGYKLVGGGYKGVRDRFGSTSSDEYKITGSYPSTTAAVWYATGVRTHGTYSSSGDSYTDYTYSPTTYAVCVS